MKQLAYEYRVPEEGIIIAKDLGGRKLKNKRVMMIQSYDRM